MRRIDRFRSSPTLNRFGLSDLVAAADAQFKFGGMTYPLGLDTTWTPNAQEPIGNNFTAYARAAYAANGIVFACIGVRARLFSEVRFQFQDMAQGPGKLFGNQDLAILENPWPGGTTGDLLARMEQHASLAGNAFVYRDRLRNRLKVLRPDWVTIVTGSRDTDADPNGLDSELLGYVYKPGGMGSQGKAVTLLPEEVAHYAPIPDPEAQYRGMSWLTPVLSEITADKAATEHKLKFFENAATPNLAITYPKEITPDQLDQYLKLLDEDHAGVMNAYKTLHLGGGADPKIIGSNLEQLNFKAVQGAGETRIAAASGIAPIIVGISEGLDAATYSNYGQARRSVGDQWARPAWRNVAGSLAQIVPAPNNSRLWYDPKDVSFLQEDELDAAEIMSRDAQTARTLVDAGFDPASVVSAVKAGDLNQLVHSGLYSVQLQTPGSGTPPNGATP